MANCTHVSDARHSFPSSKQSNSRRINVLTIGSIRLVLSRHKPCPSAPPEPQTQRWSQSTEAPVPERQDQRNGPRARCPEGSPSLEHHWGRGHGSLGRVDLAASLSCRPRASSARLELGQAELRGSGCGLGTLAAAIGRVEQPAQLPGLQSDTTRAQEVHPVPPWALKLVLKQMTRLTDTDTATSLTLTSHRRGDFPCTTHAASAALRGTHALRQPLQEPALSPAGKSRPPKGSREKRPCCPDSPESPGGEAQGLAPHPAPRRLLPDKAGCHYLPETVLISPESLPGRVLTLGVFCRVLCPLWVASFFPI